MFDAYAKLPALLELQRLALAGDDRQELDSLNRQIDELSREINEMSGKIDELDPASRRRLRTLVAEAQAEVAKNMSLWQESMDRFREAGEALQATRRYYSQFQNIENAGRRYSRRG